MNMCAHAVSVDWIEIVIAVILAVIPAAISYSSHKREVIRATMDFLNQGNTKEEKRRRKRVYDMYNKKKHMLTLRDLLRLDANGDLGKIISFYDMWAYMAKRGYLPKQTFYGSNGVTAVRMYIMLYPYIQYRRNKEAAIEVQVKNCLRKIRISNELYAGDYQWLVKRIVKRIGKQAPHTKKRNKRHIEMDKRAIMELLK